MAPMLVHFLGIVCPATYDGAMPVVVLEIFFVALLIAASIAIAFVSAVVLVKLFKGQR